MNQKNSIGESALKTLSENRPKFLSFEQFADELQICVATARRMASRGELKAVRINSRLVRIPVDEVDRILNSAAYLN
jgi:excisionase family DNA binding protein